MPARVEVRPRERVTALAAAALVQLALGLVLLSGLRVQIGHAADTAQRLIEIALRNVPPPQLHVEVNPRAVLNNHAAPAPKAPAPRPGGSPGRQPAHAPPSMTPVVSLRPSTAPSGGGSGSGPAIGAGAGGGSGGQGYGDEGGGTDLVKIAGDILPSDYPKRLGNAGIGGRVSVTFTVEANGRISGCRITRSSGIAELDALTCRLMEERFRFRPSTDRYGRPIRDEVDWDHDWIAPRG